MKNFNCKKIYIIFNSNQFYLSKSHNVFFEILNVCSYNE